MRADFWVEYGVGTSVEGPIANGCLKIRLALGLWRAVNGWGEEGRGLCGIKRHRRQTQFFFSRTIFGRRHRRIEEAKSCPGILCEMAAPRPESRVHTRDGIEGGVTAASQSRY